jgi:8-oxo-dGTP pyrophosphatase MutT (NUDIX family)
MNKKLYYNNNSILLCTEHIQPAGNQLIVDTENLDIAIIDSHIRHFIQQSENKDLILIGKNVDSLFSELKKSFHYIEAAGGLIEQDHKYLFIYRLGKWDLPKGKIDKGESAPEAAVRECEEECAISGLQIISELPSTYHIYPYKTGHALKTTYWYRMKSSHKGKLSPQTEENIEKVEWLDIAAIKTTVLKNTYLSVRDVIFEGIHI